MDCYVVQVILFNQMKKELFILIFICIGIKGYSQNLPLGAWSAHLPWNKGVSVADAGSKIYCAAEDGLFSYDKNDNSLATFSKVNGLSDKGLTLIRYNLAHHVLFVAYDNSNIDLIYDNEISNITDIKRKNIVGSKAINDVTFVGSYAYLACGFGIVVLDLEKLEIKDTYYIGPNGGSINVSSLAFDGSNLFASTDSGVYRININDPNINIYSAWNQVLSVSPTIKYSQVVFFNNKIYLRVDRSNNNDSLLVYDYTNWTNTGIGFWDMRKLQVSNNKLIVTATIDVKVFDTLQEIRYANAFTYPCWMLDATYDNAGNLWIADNNKGLVKINSALEVAYYIPNGPRSSKCSEIKIENNQLWVGHSYQGRKWSNLYSSDGFSTYANNQWTTYDKNNLTSSIVSLDSLYDFMALAVDSRNSNHVFFGSRGFGLLEVENGSIRNYYNEFNSTLQSAMGNPGSCQTGGIAFDDDHNLWVVNSTVNAPLSVLKTDGTWQAFSFPVNPPYLNLSVSGAFAGEILCDSYGQKWIDFNESGILVFDDKAGKYRFLNSEEGKGHLPNNDVRTMVEDRDGQVWIGTAEGVAVFYNPSSILTSSNFDAQQVLLFQGENYQYLLETEVVTSIAVDGANRKWFGTENSGAYLMSADGTKQILHFTEDNSPLLSNNVSAIGINQKTGDVFFGTERGICSYRGDATEGGETCEDYNVFPNPVRHEYHGPIAIQGLVANASVKITDLSGQVVYQTKAKGGLATWDGNNFSGERAKTGVYLVYVTNEDGSATCVTKMLFSN
jgi:hypothetical protein